MYNPKLYHPPEKYTHEVAVLDSDSHSIPLVLLSLTNRAHYLATLIYSHGNSSDLSQSLTFVSAMAQLHPYLDFIVYDYTGYGQSKLTQMTQESICSDLKTVM